MGYRTVTRMGGAERYVIFKEIYMCPECGRTIEHNSATSIPDLHCWHHDHITIMERVFPNAETK